MDYEIMLDATHAFAGNIPTAAVAVGGYVTGTPDILWTMEDWRRFPYAGQIRIDQSPDLDIFAQGNADHARISEGDIEPGAGTIAAFVKAAKAREEQGLQSTAYISQSGLPAITTAVANAAVKGVRYFVANWSLSLSRAIFALSLNPAWVGVQFASPSSNPFTFVPGTSMTLLEANVDISVKKAGWFGSTAPSMTAWLE